MELELPQIIRRRRLKALRRFALAITLLNVLGHTVLGFEQSDLQAIASVLAAYATEMVIEVARIWGTGQSPRYMRGSLQDRVDFFLPAHISGLAVGMLLYANDRVGPVVFAAVVAIASKAILRVPVGERLRHFMNPSNLGITVTLITFHWVGVAMPYQFTENLPGTWAYALPCVVMLTGSLVNARLTGRLPLIMAWLVGFGLQAGIRSLVEPEEVRLLAALNVMSGPAFILFTFYMISDPQTTPEPRGETAVWTWRRILSRRHLLSWEQIGFGFGAAVMYGLLMSQGVVYTLFFCLSLNSAMRGVLLWCRRSRIERPVTVAIAGEVSPG